MEKYKKKQAAEDLGISVAILNKIISLGQLPHDPTEADVLKFKKKNDQAFERCRASILEAHERGCTVDVCAFVLRNAVERYHLWLHTGEKPRDVTERIIYEHEMEGDKNG